MPINLPKLPFVGELVVTAHRGNILADRQDNRVVKALTGQPKDDLYARRENAKRHDLVPRPKERGMLPGITIEQATDYTRYATDKGLRKAGDTLPTLVNTPTEVAQQVAAYMQRKLAALAAPGKTLVLVGEEHVSPTAALIKMAALAQLKGRQATFLQEYADRKTVDGIARTAASLGAVLRTEPGRLNTSVQSIYAASGLNPKIALGDLLSVLVALHAGADVGHFDSLVVSAKHQDQRESAMVRSIGKSVQRSAGPVIVVVGKHHLPALHESLRGRCNIVALSSITDASLAPRSSDHRKRTSYVLSNPDIMTLRGTPALESGNVDMLSFLRNDLKIDLNVDPGEPGGSRSRRASDASDDSQPIHEVLQALGFEDTE